MDDPHDENGSQDEELTVPIRRVSDEIRSFVCFGDFGNKIQRSGVGFEETLSSHVMICGNKEVVDSKLHSRHYQQYLMDFCINIRGAT